MNILHAINGIHTANPYLAAETKAVPAVGEGSFSSFLQEAIGNVVGTDYFDKLSGVQAVAGGDVDIHSAVIDAQKAEIALNLTIQIRNKLLESYQEIMRMQI